MEGAFVGCGFDIVPDGDFAIGFLGCPKTESMRIPKRPQLLNLLRSSKPSEKTGTYPKSYSSSSEEVDLEAGLGALRPVSRSVAACGVDSVDGFVDLLPILLLAEEKEIDSCDFEAVVVVDVSSSRSLHPDETDRCDVADVLTSRSYMSEAAVFFVGAGFGADTFDDSLPAGISLSLSRRPIATTASLIDAQTRQPRPHGKTAFHRPTTNTKAKREVGRASKSVTSTLENRIFQCGL